MVDVLDALTDDAPADDDDALSEPTLFVCDAIGDDGVICGASFDTNAQLNGHKQGKHRDRSGDAKRGEGGKAKPDKKPSRPKPPPEPKATTNKIVGGAPTNRTATYASSIAMAGMMAYVAVPGFDTFDLDVVNKGATPLAAALDAVGETNQTVRTACDLALGGGTGGAYVQLIMAALSIGAPIAAHHGWLPGSAGERFGSMIGVMPEPSPPSSAPPARPAAEGAPSENGEGVMVIDPHTMTDDDWMNLVLGIPPHVFANLAGRLMGGEGAIGVSIPGTFDIPDGESSLAVPTPEGSSTGPES